MAEADIGEVVGSLRSGEGLEQTEGITAEPGAHSQREVDLVRVAGFDELADVVDLLGVVGLIHRGGPGAHLAAPTGGTAAGPGFVEDTERDEGHGGMAMADERRVERRRAVVRDEAHDPVPGELGGLDLGESVEHLVEVAGHDRPPWARGTRASADPGRPGKRSSAASMSIRVVMAPSVCPFGSAEMGATTVTPSGSPGVGHPVGAVAEARAALPTTITPPISVVTSRSSPNTVTASSVPTTGSIVAMTDTVGGSSRASAAENAR